MKAHLPLLIIWLLVLVLVEPSNAERALFPEERMRHRLERIIIPKLEFHDVGYAEALETLRREGKHYDPHGRGVPIFIDAHPAKSPSENSPSPEPPTTTNTPPSNPQDPKITVSLTNIPVIEALKYVIGLSGHKFWLAADGVHITDLDTPDPLVTRIYRVPRDLIPAYEEQDRIDQTHAAAMMKTGFREYLIEHSAKFPAGATATLNKSRSRITVHNTPLECDVIEGILQYDRPACTRPIPESEEPKEVGGPFDFPEHSLLIAEEFERMQSEGWRKLRRIILPKVSIENLTIDDATHLLTELAARSTPFHQLAETIVSPLTRNFSVSPGLPDATRVTYTAANVSLAEALQAVAASSGRVVMVEHNRIALYKADPSPGHFSVYLVPPTLAATLRKAPSMSPDEAARKWLESEGVDPGPAAVITYIPAQRFLFQDNGAKPREILDRIEKAWRDYYAAGKTGKEKAR